MKTEKKNHIRVQVIEHLRKLEEQTKKGNPVDWFREKVIKNILKLYLKCLLNDGDAGSAPINN